MTSNVAQSVHQRLLNLAREQGRTFQQLLVHYTLERFLYRLGLSPHADHFVLKGGLMFRVWEGPLSRPTRDIDLLAHTNNSVENIAAIIRSVCRQEVPQDDGLVFHEDSVEGSTIAEVAAYPGVRVKLIATLGSARIPLHADMGFSDTIIPGAVPIQLPTLLDYPPPALQGYTQESAIAEKLQAMVYLGEINSRMKDFYDIWSLASRFSFDGATLASAINTTFKRRSTVVPERPQALEPTFAARPDKQRQWRAFVRRQLSDEARLTLEDVVADIQKFLLPLLAELVATDRFEGRWNPGGPWETKQDAHASP